jgi:hypothetical protein
MPEVLTPKLTREELVRRLESLQAQCAELANYTLVTDFTAEGARPWAVVVSHWPMFQPLNPSRAETFFGDPHAASCALGFAVAALPLARPNRLSGQF